MQNQQVENTHQYQDFSTDVISDRKIDLYSDYIAKLANTARSQVNQNLREGKPIAPQALKRIEKEAKRAVKKFKNTLAGMEAMPKLDLKEQQEKDMAGVTLTLVRAHEENPNEGHKSLGMMTVLERMRKMKDKVEAPVEPTIAKNKM